MNKILYISNIGKKRMKVDFLQAAIIASKNHGIDFYCVANRSESGPEDVRADEEQYKIKLYHADISRTPFSVNNLKAYKQIKDIIKNEGIDYIHCNTPVGGVLGRLCGKSCGVKKIIYQVHGFHFYKGAPLFNWLIYYPIERILARLTDAIITINKEDYELAQKFKLRKGGKAYYVPGVGIDTEQYKLDYDYTSEKRKELGLKDDDILVISTGELNKNKNNAVIIEAIAKIKNPKIHYILCGIGELESELKLLANKLGVDKNIHFLGYRTDVKELLNASDIFVMSSFREGLSRSIMEAMSSGLPCVVSKIRGNVDLVKQEKNGFLCEPTDIESYAEAINTLAKDKALRMQIAHNNLDDINNFDIKKIVNMMTEIYSEQM